MGTATGALHHVFFFVEDEPLEPGPRQLANKIAVTSEQTSPDTVNPVYLSSDVDYKLADALLGPEHGRSDSTVAFKGVIESVSVKAVKNPVTAPTQDVSEFEPECASVAQKCGAISQNAAHCLSSAKSKLSANNSKSPVLSLIDITTANEPIVNRSNTSPPLDTHLLSVSAPAFVPPGSAPVFHPAITATAAEFVPSTQMSASGAARTQRKSHGGAVVLELTSPFFEQRKTVDKGIGLYATRKIPIGTRLICEAPLLQIRSNDITLVLDAYRSLPKTSKEIYDRLHAYAPTELNLEQEILLKFGVMSNKSELAQHLKIMSIFSANDFLLADQCALGVFENVSRINHSCIPNVHFSNNAELSGKETVHAARDIEEGEELVANYIGGRANYQRAEQRRKYLSKHYGFVCQCDACSNNPVSDANRETLQFIVWGLNEYKYQDGTTIALYEGNPFYPASRHAALAQAVDAISLLLREKLVTSELAKAYRFASDFALGLRQYEQALEHALNESDIERAIFGKEVRDLKNLGLASEQWITSIQSRMDEDGIRMPGEKFWSKFPGKKAWWNDLRKAEKKRFAGEKRYEAGQGKKFEQNRKSKAKKKTRDGEERKAKLQGSKKTQDRGEDKENAGNEEAVNDGSE